MSAWFVDLILRCRGFGEPMIQGIVQLRWPPDQDPQHQPRLQFFLQDEASEARLCALGRYAALCDFIAKGVSHRPILDHGVFLF